MRLCRFQQWRILNCHSKKKKILFLFCWLLLRKENSMREVLFECTVQKSTNMEDLVFLVNATWQGSYFCHVKVFSRCVRNWFVVFLWPVLLWVKVLHWMGTWTRSCGPLPSCTIPHLSMTTKICLIKSPKIPMCSSFQTLQPNLPQDPPNCPCPRDPPPSPPRPSVRTPHHVSVLR